MKTNTILKSEEEYVAFLEKDNNINSGYIISKFGKPKQYPCKIEFRCHRVEIDDVGFGFDYEYEVYFIYKEDVEKIIQEQKDLLKTLDIH